MVELKVVDYSIPEDSTILSATWELYDTDDFENNDPIFSSIDDEVNLFYLLGNIVLDLDVSYYSRMRFNLNTGTTVWSNVTIGVVDNTYNSTELVRFSGFINPPIINFIFNTNMQPMSLGVATLDFTIPDNLVLDSVTWVIEDLNGNLMYIDEYSKNTTRFSIPIILKANNVYVLKAKVHTTGGDSSTFGSSTFYISDNNLLFPNNTNFVIKPLTSNDYILVINNLQQDESIIIEAYYDEVKIGELTTFNLGIVLNDIIPPNILNGYVLLRARKIYNGEQFGDWSYRAIVKGNLVKYCLPGDLPYDLNNHNCIMGTYNLPGELPYIM